MSVTKVFMYVLCLTSVYSDCARILGIVPTPCYSHQVVFQPIWKELSLRGHHVTTITTNPMKDPALTNLSEIDLHASYDIWNKRIAAATNLNLINLLLLVTDLTVEIGHFQLSHPEVQKLINDDTAKFDLIMVEYSLLPMFAFSKRFGAPTIIITSVDAFSDLLKIMGSPTHPIVYPDLLMPVRKVATLTDRLLNVMMYVAYNSMRRFYDFPRQQVLVDQYFGKGYPPLEELTTDVSLVLANSEPVFHSVKPFLPTIVQFGGGTHRTSFKPLPAGLKDILDEAQNGFIYFSLGSHFKAKNLPEKVCNVILNAFAELPYTVLWKFEVDVLPNKPPNVITSKWFPQQDILKHPNIKLFITQGGLQSLDEAIYDFVPMVGMPIFGDQEFNVKGMVSKGLGVYLNYQTMTKEDLKNAILEVINNPSYKSKIKKMAQLALDQPISGLEKAIWWTEYVIRHNGTKHLRSPALDIPFYQYYLLDVIAVFLVIFIGILAVLVFSLKRLLKVLFRFRPSPVQKAKVN